MTVVELDKFIYDRLFSGKRYAKEKKKQLCRELERWQVEPAPTEQQLQIQAAQLLLEIRKVSTDLTLPAYNDVDVTWSSSYTDVPEVNLIMIHTYFVMTPSQDVTAHSLTAYKSLSSYQTAVEGSVKELKVSIGLPRGWVYMKASVRPSCRNQTWYRVWCLLNKETVRAFLFI